MFPLLMSLTNGGPGHASENIALYIYNEAFKSHRMGYASALAVVLTIVMAVIAGLQMRLTKEDSLVDLRSDVSSHGFCNHEFF